VAFPLAALAIARNSDALAALALDQLRIRQARLWHDGALWLRYRDDGQRSFRNWARAVAWYLLGLVRTLELLRDRVIDVADLEAEACRVGNWVQGFQRDDGLWAAYVDDPGLAADASGSAGIAAALALGARIGVLPQAATGAARRTLDGLQNHLTPDGFLGGATQANRGGEVLQRSDYRVLSQVAMGLQAQLIAELSALEKIG
jgi:rhamnogalacturonyl hydrolase YesR